MQATYTKLRDGSWGIRYVGSAVAAGSSITVAKRDGTTKVETIDRVLWTDGKGTQLCSIQQARTAPARGGNLRETYRRRYGWDGVVGSASYYSSGLYDEES